MAGEIKGIADNLRMLRALSDALGNLPIVAGNAYTGKGTGQAKGIVLRHFTPGNSDRYGWQPLSPDYFKRKQGDAKENRVQQRRHGFTVSQIDPKATTRGKTAGTSVLFGASAGVVTGKNLPMLVATGKLRFAIESTGKVARTGPDAATMTWQVPEYGEFHHIGAGNNPRRSPIDPNKEDVDLIHAAVTKFLESVVGRGRTSFPAG